MSFLIKYFLPCVFLSALVASDGVFAAPMKGVVVTLKSIRALGEVEESKLAERKDVLIDTRLRALESELRALPYKVFQLLDQDVFVASPKRKHEIRLVTGQTLKLRLLSESVDEICLWLRWQDRKGTIILDTRLHPSFGHTILAGAETVSQTGAVLAIDVQKND